MHTYYEGNLTNPEPRLFPYGPADATQSGFVDFIQQPELIETCLEDFRPFAGTQAVETFYEFLRWINGPTSHLATCDCGLFPPAPHSDRNSEHALRITGRVFILFRDLRGNSSLSASDWLCVRMMNEMTDVDSNFSDAKGVVGFTKQLALQTGISNGTWRENGKFESSGANDPGFGHHLMLTFFAYGQTEEETFESLNRVFKNIRVTAEKISALIGEGLNAAIEAAR